MTAAVALRPAATRLLPITPPSSSRLAALVTMLSLTALLSLVAPLQLRREAALVRLRTDFTSSVSHELRTPLAQILLFGETLRLGRARTDAERRLAIDTIVEEGRRLMHLVDNLLQFDRAARGPAPLALIPIALAEVVQAACATFADGSMGMGMVNLPAMVIVLLVTGLLTLGIKRSANANTALVIIKSLVLVAFVLAGAAYVKRENLVPLIPPNTGEFGHFGWSGVLRGAGVIFFAYIGFDAVSTAAQESRNPQRDLPVGILVSLAVCTVLFIGVAIVLIGIVPYTRLNVADPLAVGIDATGLTWLRPLVKIGAILGLFSTILVQMIGQTRIFYSMSRDGLLPAVFGRVHPRFRTPHVSTLLTGTVCALVAGFTPISVLSELVSTGTLLAFVLVCIGIVVLRRTNPHALRPFRTPGLPWVPAAGAIICLAQMLALPWPTWQRLVVWLAIGMGVYVLYARANAERVRAALGA